MILLLNYSAGCLIRIISLLVLKLNSSLKFQYVFIKETIATVNKIKNGRPEHLPEAIIEIEDKRFFHHLGVDFYSIIRALVKNTTTNRLEGASTIVQQLIRNITNERQIKFKRKIKEIILASLVDKVFSKDEILMAYLATYRFKNCIGIFTLCQCDQYDVNNLSVNESAQIAARFKYPFLHKANYINYLKRVRTIERKITLKNNLAKSRCHTQYKADDSLIDFMQRVSDPHFKVSSLPNPDHYYCQY